NYQARNFMRAMKKGDRALFYASNADPSGAAGVAEIVREAFPDPFQFQKGHEYHDSRSDPRDPMWSSVEIRFVERFRRVVPLAEMRSTPGLEGMEILKKGSRLSVTPVTKTEFAIVTKLGRSPGSSE
ncbi:MAG TPA: EVE domain-containing protein, partial [Thermoanaerobaculia bacterium]|nr:EVE domain-containing protein [Thermoanaerobaculia bacterium]